VIVDRTRHCSVVACSACSSSAAATHRGRGFVL
jgi:hypothetical protein